MAANVNFHGAIGGVQVGDNNTQHVVQHNGQSSPTVEQVVEKINEAIPESEPEDLKQKIQHFASLSLEEQKADSSQLQSIISRIEPYAPHIGKSLAVFGEAALTTLGATNPLLAGIIAVCRRVAQG